MIEPMIESRQDVLEKSKLDRALLWMDQVMASSSFSALTSSSVQHEGHNYANSCRSSLTNTTLSSTSRHDSQRVLQVKALQVRAPAAPGPRGREGRPHTSVGSVTEDVAL